MPGAGTSSTFLAAAATVAREKRCEGDHACDGACVSHGVTSVAANLVLTGALTFETAFARGSRKLGRCVSRVYVEEGRRRVLSSELTRRGVIDVKICC